MDFAESVFSRKNLAFAHVLSCYFISDLFVRSPGCYVLGAHSGLTCKELVPIIHLSSYFVSYPWVHLLRIFIFLKATCLSHTSLNIKFHAHCISSLSSNRSETWNSAHETSAWNYLALKCLKWRHFQKHRHPEQRKSKGKASHWQRKTGVLTTAKWSVLVKQWKIMRQSIVHAL